jgi:hypothetical protein
LWPTEALDRVNPFGVRVNAIFSSDVGHFDVPDLLSPAPEAYDKSEIIGARVSSWPGLAGLARPSTPSISAAYVDNSVPKDALPLVITHCDDVIDDATSPCGR